MTRDEKVGVVSDLKERFARSCIALVATNKGLSVSDAIQLRRKLRAADGEYKVAKLTLVRRALPDTGFDALADFLEGPRGLVFGYAEPVGIAKALVEFANESKKITVEGGALEGEAIGSEQVEALASMPSIEELRARTVMMVTGPARRVASCVTGPATRIAGALAARVKKLEEDGAAA